MYLGEIPRLVRDKKYRQITSSKLYEYVKRQSAENNEKQRTKMESFRNEAVARINDLQRSVKLLFAAPQFNKITLSDIIKPPSENSLNHNNNIEITHLQTKILSQREEFQFISKILKENRAPQFSKIRSIFRASQHNFSASQYHKAVDGICPTLTIIQNSLGKKFGAFLNSKIQQKEEWIADTTGLSFIFSIDREQVFKLKPEAGCRMKAAFGGL